MPKVSVIIPVYGVENYIERCARSLFEQKLDDIEYLFIDDCTPDNSIDVLNRVLNDYPHRKSQVIIHKMDNNSGQAAVREWGMLNATGEYVIHCDSDDWVDIDMYRVMYEKGKKENADIVVCDYFITDFVNYNIITGCKSLDPIQFFRDCSTMNCSWALWNKLIKTDIIKYGIVYPKANMGEDMVIILQAILNASNISYVKKPYYYYYTNPQSITNSVKETNIIARSKQYLENATLLIDEIKIKKIDELLKDEIVFIKWIARRNLWIITDKPKYFKEWKKIWPEISRCVLKNRYITRGDKIKFILTYLRLYPSVPKLIRKHSANQ